MIKRAMIALAASAALVPAAAMAQTVADPALDAGLPNMALSLPASALAAASTPAPVEPGREMQLAQAGLPMMPPPQVGMPAYRQMQQMQPMVRMYRQNGMNGQTQMRRSVHFNRINRGGMVPRSWFGPQFQISNWGLYGFPPPGAGGRWIRYYDDALLIDGAGRVLDGRYGMDWDRYGDQWAYNDDGAPYARDRGRDRDSDEWEEEREERGGGDRARDSYHHEEHGGGAIVHVERHRMPYGYGAPMPPPPPGYGGYGYGYGGYGYGAGMVVVTETTVTTPPVVEMRTYYSTVTERVRVRHRARCLCVRPAPRPAPRPRAGERG